MKKIFTFWFPIAIGVLLSTIMFAQSPEKISYQAVVRDAENNLLTNQTVGMQITIVHGSSEGTEIYVETHAPVTNENGLISIEIGEGTALSGAFIEINWENGPYFIRSETDPEGGTDYSIKGTSQLLSVPYALYANEAGNIPDVSGIALNTQAIQDTAAQLRADMPDVSGIITEETDPSVPEGTQVGQMQYWDGSNWVTIVPGANGAILILVDGVPKWIGGDSQPEEVTNPATGKIWMDRNLGALQVAISSSDFSSYGDLYQWGRSSDGHQERNSPTTTTLSSSDHVSSCSNCFIITDSSPNDWRSPQNDNLWQGLNGINNPCPSGFRIPTYAEWDEEINSWSDYTASAALASHLRLPLAGYRNFDDGLINNENLRGTYWASTINGNSAMALNITNSNVWVDVLLARAYGFSVRCIKDYETPLKTVTNPTTGKTWQDRNLGATQVATQYLNTDSYGDLYQWGRDSDGHQIRTSGTTTTLSESDTAGHGLFILTAVSPNDWRNPQNDTLWKGVSGTNNPCPGGFRLPTHAEWDAERLSWSSLDAAGAFASPLKLPLAGYRHTVTGNLDVVGSQGYYWSSSVFGINSVGLFFNSSSATMTNFYRGSGFSVRCIED